MNSAIGGVRWVSSRMTSRSPITTGQVVGVQNQSLTSTNVAPCARATRISPLMRSGRTASARGVAQAVTSSRWPDRQAGGSESPTGMSPMTTTWGATAASRAIVASAPAVHVAASWPYWV